MMKEIGEEMHQSTFALTISKMVSPNILDMCMAPGGFLATTLKKNPEPVLLALACLFWRVATRCFCQKIPV
jgi:hypothetical protein